VLWPLRQMLQRYRQVIEDDHLEAWRFQELGAIFAQAFSSKRVKRSPLPETLKRRVRDR